MARLRNVVGCILLTSSLATAELVIPLNAGISQDNPDNKKTDDVYVRESTTAVEKIALAEKMERLKEWDKSATIYQEVITNYADRVIPNVNKEGKVVQYSSVAILVQSKLSNWPEEGLKAYRSRYEDDAAALLAAAGDNRQKLSTILWIYFPTESAKNAAIKLIAASFEEGEFASAAWVGRRILDLHPLLVNERPMVLFQTALALQLCGNLDQAQKCLDELKSRFPQQTGTIHGEDVVLADELTKLLASNQSISKVTRSDNWPMQFGSADASAIPTHITDGGARLFSTEIVVGTARNVAPQMRQQQKKAIASEINLGNMTGILPVVDQQELFFQDNAKIYAINLASGLPLAGWEQTYPGDKKGAFAIESYPNPRGKPLGITVNDRHVISILGQADYYNPYMSESPVRPQLYCLDRTTGKKIWNVDLAKLNVPQEQSNLREGTLGGCPLVVNGMVYAVVNVNKMQFEECHLVCFSEADGSYQWSTYIASVSTNISYDEESNPVSGNSPATMSYADGRLYVQSNIGVLACIEAAEGKPIWVNRYGRQSGRPGFTGGRVNRYVGTYSRGRPYTINPPIVQNGQIFVLPTDGENIMIYDAASGDEIRRISRVIDTRNQSEPVVMLLGNLNDELILASNSMVYTVPWKTFDPEKTPLENNCRYKSFSSSGSKDKDESSGIRGRPLVTATHILVPISTQLQRITLDKSFKIDSTYPATPKGAWDENDECPGNVIATQDHLIVAGARHVMAYADMKVVTAKLDQKIAEKPGDVAPYIRYAELYFVAGRQVEAIDWLDKAINVLGGKDSLVKGKDRDHFFDLVTSYAIKYEKNNASSPEIIRQLYDRAKMSADSPEQKVRYAFAHAASLIKNENLTGAVALYQQILSDPAQRTVSVSGKQSGLAAGAAEEAIIALLKKDTKLYEQYESQAAQQFAALSTNDQTAPDQYLELADQFPIDKTGSDSLKKAASLFESKGRTREAIQTLRRLISKAHGSVEKATSLDTLARLYATSPAQLDLAIVRMKQANELTPQGKIALPIAVASNTIPAGQTYSDALALLKSYRSREQTLSLPTFKLPTGENATTETCFEPAQTMDYVQGIVHQLPPGSRNDRVVILRPDLTVTQLEAGTLKLLHDPVKIGEKPSACIYSQESLIVVSPQKITAIDPSGKITWQVDLTKLPTVDLADDDDDQPIRPAVAQQENGVVINRGFNQRIMVLNGQRVFMNNNGEPVANSGVQTLIPTTSLLPQIETVADLGDNTASERVHGFKLLNDRLIFTTSTGRIACISLVKGNTLWQSQLSDHGYSHVLAIDDYTVVSTLQSDGGSSELAVIDNVNGKVLKRISTAANPNTPSPLVNLCLSSDGILVMLYGNAIQSVDLYSIDQPMVRYPIKNQNEFPFQQSYFSEQMVISNDRILIIYNSPTNQKSVRVYDLHTLQPIRMRNPNNQNADLQYPSQAPVDAQQELSTISIRTAGPWTYIVGPRSLRVQNLDNDEWWWSGSGANSQQSGPVRDLILTQDYCLLFNQSKVPNPRANATIALKIYLSMYSRATVKSGSESGVLKFNPVIADPSSVLIGQWQVANDSLYYVNDDKKLKLLKVNSK